MSTDTTAVEQIVRAYHAAADYLLGDADFEMDMDLATRAYTAGAASRDARIAELEAQLAATTNPGQP